MGTPQEAVVRQCLALFHSTGQPDLARIAPLFAEDATYHALVPRGPVHRGRAAILAELGLQFSRYDECNCEILAMASTQRHVFTERRDHVSMHKAARRIYSSVNAVFELDEQLRIVAWREYWDAGDIARQLGITVEQLDQHMLERHS